MALQDQNSLLGIAAEDDLGIVYLVENAQQFWSELEDTLNTGTHGTPSLSLLDATLRRYLALCAAYHEQYLQTPLQLEHACNLLLDSDLFQFHSERMSEIIVDDLQSRTDPHYQLIFYHVLLCYGRRRPEYLRSHKRWQPLLPLLMDHILVEIDPDVEDTYFGIAGGSTGGPASVPVPIEAKLRSLSMRLLYDVCCMQKLSLLDLRIFDDSFIDYLFDMVEQTRNMPDETFNYSVIKLIVALNEQFMVASLPMNSGTLQQTATEPPEMRNRVLIVLMRRLGSSKTFGENMIFMLNRAQRTPEDLCMQLLILKILYVLFTGKGTSEYFYTNDLCVLVDVFLRELVDLDEDSESLRHTYLRVLHPLLTRTQLRDITYKRPQIVYSLESLLGNSKIRDVNPTTKRLVERCLSGEWCVQLRKNKIDEEHRQWQEPQRQRKESISSQSSTSTAVINTAALSPTQVATTPSAVGIMAGAAAGTNGTSGGKSLKSIKSVEQLRASKQQKKSQQQQQVQSHFHLLSPLDRMRSPSNASSVSLPGVANTTTITTIASSRDSANAVAVTADESKSLEDVSAPPATPNFKRNGATSSVQAHVHGSERRFHPPVIAESGFEPDRCQLISSAGGAVTSDHISDVGHTIFPPSSTASTELPSPHRTTHRRTAPPPPPKRRKPPAVPAPSSKAMMSGVNAHVEQTHGGAMITTIRSSTAAVIGVNKTVVRNPTIQQSVS